MPQTDLVLEAGPLPQFPSSMLAILRKLGLNLQIERAELSLNADFVAAESGVPLNAEQAKLLVHLGVKLVKFQAAVLCRWSSGEFEELAAM